jgi:hypothetical protein
LMDARIAEPKQHMSDETPKEQDDTAKDPRNEYAHGQPLPGWMWDAI